MKPQVDLVKHFPPEFLKTLQILRNVLHMLLIHLPLNAPNLALQELDTVQKSLLNHF